MGFRVQGSGFKVWELGKTVILVSASMRRVHTRNE